MSERVAVVTGAGSGIGRAIAQRLAAEGAAVVVVDVLEGGPFGITVNAICPAYVRTPLVENQIAAQAETHGISAEEVVQSIMLEPAAIKRLIEPEEIADLVAYLCSDRAAAVTGAAWTVDLGWTAR